MSPTSRDRNFPKNEAHTHTRGQTTQRNWSSKVSAGQNVDPPIVTQYDIRQISASAFQIRNYPPAGSSHLLPFEEDSNGAIYNRIPVVKRSGKPSRAPTQAPTLPGDIDTPVTGLNPSSRHPQVPRQIRRRPQLSPLTLLKATQRSHHRLRSQQSFMSTGSGRNPQACH